MSSGLLQLLLHLVLPIARWLEPPLTVWLGTMWFLIGVAMAGAAIREFRKAGTPMPPFSEPSVLVTSGPYRFSRNPMYLGMVLILFGNACTEGTFGALLPIPLFMALVHRMYIRHEEGALERRFGEEYHRHRSRVRRWM